MNRNTIRNIVFRKILMRVLLIVVATIMLFPFLWMISGAFKPSDEVMEYPPKIIPSEIRYENFTELFKEVPFGRYMINSFIVAGSVTIFSLLFHSMAGYALARLRFPGKRFLFIGILSTMMIPFYAIVIPLFIIIRQVGWYDTYLGLIIPWIPHAFGIFLLRQYYITFPKELVDAAVIDGCSHIGVFFRIALPLSKPILAALGVIFFISNWDRFLWPLIITSSAEMRVVPLGIVQLKGQYVAHWNLILAGATIACIPTIIIFILLQNFIVKGIKTTGIKQ
jgi:multiple sugar transport system permease protein